MATHTDTASVTYGKLSELLAAEKKAWLDVICPAGKDLILSYNLEQHPEVGPGKKYPTWQDFLAAKFPGTTWSGKTTNICVRTRDGNHIYYKNERNTTIILQQHNKNNTSMAFARFITPDGSDIGNESNVYLQDKLTLYYYTRLS